MKRRYVGRREAMVKGEKEGGTEVWNGTLRVEQKEDENEGEEIRIDRGRYIVLRGDRDTEEGWKCRKYKGRRKELRKKRTDDEKGQK